MKPLAMASPRIRVYDGHGAGMRSAIQAKEALQAHTKLQVDFINTRELLEGEWCREAGTTSLICFPGGADLPYCRDLNGRGNALIKEYVKRGGSYLGFCAGAYYACSSVLFEPGSKLEVIGERELAFFPGCGRGSAYPGFDYMTEHGAAAATIRFRANYSLHAEQQQQQGKPSQASTAVPSSGGSSYPTIHQQYSSSSGGSSTEQQGAVGSRPSSSWGLHPHQLNLPNASPPHTPNTSLPHAPASLPSHGQLPQAGSQLGSIPVSGQTSHNISIPAAEHASLDSSAQTAGRASHDGSGHAAHGSHPPAVVCKVGKVRVAHEELHQDAQHVVGKVGKVRAAQDAAQLVVGKVGKVSKVLWHNCLDYTNGGPVFMLPDHCPPAATDLVTVLAQYRTPLMDSSHSKVSGTKEGQFRMPLDGKVAAVRCQVGAGMAVLCATHPELNPRSLYEGELANGSDPHVERIAELLRQSKEERTEYLRLLLAACCQSWHLS